MAKKNEGSYLSCVTNGEFYFSSISNDSNSEIKYYTRNFLMSIRIKTKRAISAVKFLLCKS